MAHKTVGLIGVPCAEQARWSAFYGSLMALEKPAGWSVAQCHGQSPASNRNGIIRKALAEGAEWVFFLDDDLTFPPNLLRTLLDTGKTAVVALSMRRGVPFTPLWFNQWAPKFDSAIAMQDLPPRGELMRIKWATAGGVLIHTSVLKAMKDPWFTLGQMGPEVWNDDVHFFTKMHEETGEPLWGCTAAVCGHITHVETWPAYDAQAGWQIFLARGHQPFAVLPTPEAVCEPA